MATKTTKAAVAGPKTKGGAGTDALAKAREARERAAGEDVFKFLGKPVEGAKKLPPQAQQIVNLVESHKKSGVTREALVGEMDGVVVTKQPQGRILSYYQKRLIEEGYLSLTEAPKKEKTASKAKAAAAADEGEEEGEDEAAE